MSKFLFFLLFPIAVFAEVTLPAVFSDNMVLQRNASVKIWGNASPDEEITLTTSWDNRSYKTKTNNQARFTFTIETPGAGGPYNISFKGYNEVRLQNVMLGEVWLCSGQSNMEMNASWGIANADAEIAAANFPNIRLATVPKLSSLTPQDNLPLQWKACTPETMNYFSAVAYYFGRRLQEDLKDVPIGLICSAWGGTPAEIWTPAESISADPVLAQAANKLEEKSYGPKEPGKAWNAMIHPLVGFRIAGAIWYQGESNVGSNVYEHTFSNLIQSWRKAWGYDFPFLFVQIAPYTYGEAYGAEIRNAQRKVLDMVPGTGMVVTGDISTIEDIHPKDKKSVGERLAGLALVNVYKTEASTVDGPLYKDFTVQKNKLTISFSHADGLYFKNRKSPQFELAGADGVFYPAEARIVKGQVVLTSAQVSIPARARYNWKSDAYPDLFNKAGLPASAFDTE